MWPFKSKQKEMMKHLIPAIKEVVIEQCSHEIADKAIDLINNRIADWHMREFKTLREESFGMLKQHIRSEDFIDGVVARIKNKQLGV